MNTVKDRLSHYLNYIGISKSEFGRRIGVSSAFVTSMRKSIQPDKIISIQRSFPDLNTSWLLTGEGDMLNDGGKDMEEALLIPEDAEIKPYFKEHSVTYVPVVHIDSVGGMHSENEITAGEQYFERLIPFEEAREGDIAIYQSGDSMSPSIPSGSLLLLRKVEDWKEYIGYGNVFVLWLRDDRRITKMVTRYDEDPKNYVWCVSYNPNVPDEELPRKMIREVWKVVKFQTNLGW